MATGQYSIPYGRSRADAIYIILNLLGFLSGDD